MHYTERLAGGVWGGGVAIFLPGSYQALMSSILNLDVVV